MKTILTFSKNNQSVQIVEVENMIGYVFNAVGKESLPLAVELAILQTQRPGEFWEILRGIPNNRKGL